MKNKEIGQVDRSENGSSLVTDLWAAFVDSRALHLREKLIQQYEPLVRSIARRLYGARVDNSVSFDDFLQYGRTGLMEAVDRFDLSRGTAFSSFAAIRIKGSILNGLARETELAAQINYWRARAKDRLDSLTEELAPHPAAASLADIAAITMGLAIGALLDGDDNDVGPIDSNPANNPYLAHEVYEMRRQVRELVELLPERERIVITSHYLCSMEFQQVANQLAISKGRVSQLHAKALLRLRDALQAKPKVDRKV